MTCIVGLQDRGCVWMGADSAGISGWHLRVRRDPKVFVNGPFLFGFTSSFRMGQLLRHSFQPPVRDERVDVSKFMATTFIDAVRSCLKAGGFARKESEREEGGTFMVGYQGALFEVDSDYQVGENLDGLAAVGCGRDVALGALYATPKMDARKRVITALKAAEAFSAGVRGPFVVLSSR